MELPKPRRTFALIGRVPGEDGRYLVDEFGDGDLTKFDHCERAVVGMVRGKHLADESARVHTVGTAGPLECTQYRFGELCR